MTTLHPYVDTKTQRVRRILVKRPRLTAKLWFEKSRFWDTGFDVRFDGHPEDFSVGFTAGEAPHIAEARAALADLGLEITSCNWNDLVERATAPAPIARTLSQFVSRCLPFFRRRRAS